MPCFPATRTDTHTHTNWHSCTDGFSYMDAWGCSIGFKNTHTICKALWLIILVLQCNHAIWAWAMAEHELYGKEGDDEASKILMKPWGPWSHTHRKTPLHINFTQSYITYHVFPGPFCSSFVYTVYFIFQSYKPDESHEWITLLHSFCLKGCGVTH